MSLYSATPKDHNPNQITRTGQVKLMPAQIVAGKIIGKAIFKLSDGSTRILAAFNLGDYYHFYFTFTASKPNARRNKWKLDGWFGVYKGDYLDFEGAIQSFLQALGQAKAEGAVIIRRYPVGKKNLAQMIDTIQHPKPAGLAAGASTERVNEMMQHGRAGRMAAFLRSK